MNLGGFDDTQNLVEYRKDLNLNGEGWISYMVLSKSRLGSWKKLMRNGSTIATMNKADRPAIIFQASSMPQRRCIMLTHEPQQERRHDTRHILLSVRKFETTSG